jgi:Flp pilus assembly protein TadD
MRSHLFSARLLFIFSYLLCLAVCAQAQIGARGTRGQIFLPNGSPLQKEIRFTVTYDNGMRTEIFFTDSNGRIQMTDVSGRFTIAVESDGETYDTTSVSFDTRYQGTYLTLHLKPLKPKATPPAGTVSAGAAESKINPQASAAYETANKLVQAKEYEKAIEPLKRAISLEPNYFNAHNDLGVIYMKLNRLDEAAAAFRHAIRINDKEYLPRLNLGIVLNKQKKYKEAAEVLSGIKRNDPTMSAARTLLIEALIGSQNWAEAEKELKNALNMKDADEVDMKVRLGSVLIRQNKFEEAVAPLREAVAAEADNALAHFNLGTALLQTGKLDEAEPSLRRAYELNGASMAGTQLLLGQIYFNKKDYPKALAAFETYLRDLPDAPNAAQVKNFAQQLREALKKN